MSVTWFDGVTITVEVGFASAPSVSVAATTWTDISAYVVSIDTGTGRDTEVDTFTAGTATFVLKNSDRRFDPDHVSGPYYGNLKPMRRIRLRVAYSGTTFDEWSGFVDGWPQTYDLGNTYAEVALQATDGTKVLSRMRLPESFYSYQYANQAFGPDVWYRLGETEGTIAYDSTGNGNHGTYTNGATFGATSGLLVGSDDGAIAFDGIATVIAPPIADFPCSVECWVQVDDGAVSSSLFDQRYIDFFGSRYCVIDVVGGVVQVVLSDFGNSCLSNSNIDIGDSQPHHVAVTFINGISAPQIYVDGVQSYTSQVVTGTSRWPTAAFSSFGDGDGITIDEWALYRGFTVDPADAVDHYNWGHAPAIGDTAGARVGDVLDIVGWPAADRDIAVGGSTLTYADFGGGSPVFPFLQDIESSEQGQLYFDGAGKLVFRARTWRSTDVTATVTNATFNDTGGLPYRSLEYDWSERLMTNSITAKRTGGATVTASDATSIADYYEITSTVDGLQLEDDIQVRDLVTYRLSRYKDPSLRVEPFEIRPRARPSSLFPQVLGRKIGERITAQRLPQKVGATITQDCFIEGIRHSITCDGDWTTTWLLSPTSGWQSLVLNSTTQGKLNVNRLSF